MTEPIEIQSTTAPGFLCPSCEAFRIRISLDVFLSSQAVTCGYCGQEFHMDKSKTGRILELLQDLHIANRDVEVLRRQSL